MSFHGGKKSTSNAGDTGSIPGSVRSSGGGNGKSLQYSHGQRSLENYYPWDHKESDPTERLSIATMNNSDSYSSAQYKYTKSL